MSFKNKNTWFHAVREGREDAFHREYEAAWERVRAGLGQTVVGHAGGQDAGANSRLRENRAPWDRQVVTARAAQMTAEQALQAEKAARAAFPAWRDTPYQVRAQIIDRCADVMTERFFDLCAIMTAEVGKNRYEAAADVDEAVDFCRQYARLMVENEGYRVQMGAPFPGEDCVSLWRPYGVFAVVAPFNFPVAITTGMTVGALVTGNTVVLKPTADTPLCGRAVFECLRDAGVPAGVLNLVIGSGSTVGAALVDCADVNGYVFTGSKDVGLGIMQAAHARGPAPVIAEMGGKNPVLVTAQADLGKAVDGVYNAAFGFSGQKCSAASRVYIQEEIKEEFLNRLLMKTTNTVVGMPWEAATFMGPVVDADAVARFEEAVKLAERDGAVLCGGERVEDDGMDRGNFLAPTIVGDLPSDHELFRRELFLPFAAVDTFRTLDEAIEKANAVEFGLTAGIFTEDEAERDRFFDRIEAGVTYCNRRRGGSTGAVVDGQTFVGWKNSGTTGVGAGGRNYLKQFLREQSRTIVRE